MVMRILVVLCLCFTRALSTGAKEGACPPAPSVQCTTHDYACQIFGMYWTDPSPCNAASAAWPSSEPQLLRAVAHAVRNNKKIRVVSRHAHSATNLFCVEGNGLVISTQNYDSVIEVNTEAMTITVQAGAIMTDVIEAAAKHGLALPAMPYISGVSAAGVISTGAHGSSFAGKGSGIYEHVVGMRMIVPAPPSHGYAKIVSLTEADEDLKAAKLALGTLGAVSEITFALQPMFKRSVSVSVKDDYDLESRAESFLRAHTFGDIRWLPSHGKALFVATDRVSVDVGGDGSNSAISTPTTVADIEASAYQVDSILAEVDVDAICSLVANRTIQIAPTGLGFLNDEKRFTGYPIVGFNHRMQMSGKCEEIPEQIDESCTLSQPTLFDADKLVPHSTWRENEPTS